MNTCACMMHSMFFYYFPPNRSLAMPRGSYLLPKELGLWVGVLARPPLETPLAAAANSLWVGVLVRTPLAPPLGAHLFQHDYRRRRAGARHGRRESASAAGDLYDTARRTTRRHPVQAARTLRARGCANTALGAGKPGAPSSWKRNFFAFCLTLLPVSPGRAGRLAQR